MRASDFKGCPFLPVTAPLCANSSYVKNTDTRYCLDPSIPAVVIKGLAEHKVQVSEAFRSDDGAVIIFRLEATA